jgi:3-hydroxyacyl-[acyl-carrier-protein] dehydratase
MVVPGDQIQMDVEWTRMKGKICQMKGRALVDGELAAEGEIYATILDIAEVKPSFT